MDIRMITAVIGNKSRLLLCAALFSVILFQRTLPARAEPRTPPQFMDASCPASTTGLNVRCGYLIVPENRAQPTGTLVRMAVAIIKSTSPNPAPDPVIFLNGGPGNSSLWRLRWIADSPFLAARDVIAVDQRGTGFSLPSLDCPELVDVPLLTLTGNLTFEQAAAYHAERARACHDRLVREGVDPAQYTNADIAADMEDLRKTLGFPQVNLFGWSAGSRLALTMMRDYPTSVRAAVLDSVFMPHSVDYYAELIPNAAKTFNAVFDACAKDAACNHAYPDLRLLFLETVDHLNAQPAEFSMVNPHTGFSFTAKLNGPAFVGLLYRLLYISWNIPGLPKLIADVHRGEYRALPSLLIEPLNEPDTYQVGMNHAIHCGEAVPFTSRAAIDAAAQGVDPRYRGFYHWDLDPYAFLQVCPAWGSRPPNPKDHQLVVSSIPALIFAGTFDPASPPQHGRIVAQGLRNSTFIEFPTMGHFSWEYAGYCAKDIAAAFLKAPDKTPDSSCVAQIPPLTFITDQDVYNVSGVYRFVDAFLRAGYSLRLFAPLYAGVGMAFLGPLLLAWSTLRKPRLAKAPPQIPLAHWLAAGLIVSTLALSRLIALLFTPGIWGGFAFGLPIWGAPILYLPMINTLIAACLILLTVLAWRRGYWSLPLRLYYLTFAGVTVLVAIWLVRWLTL